MSKGPSPTAIGAFVLTGLFLAVGAAIYFGSVSFSSGNPQFVLFFDESVAGLSQSAKVKLRGVAIGQVTRITLRLPNQADTDPRIPVFIEVNTEAMRRLGALTRVSDYDVAESLRRAIERGLRGSLQMESLLTGMYYIELDFQDNPAPPVYAQDPDKVEFLEIPTIPSQFAAIGRTATDVATQIATIPFSELSGNLISLADNINALLGELRERKVIDAAAETLNELHATIQGLNRLVDRVESQIDPVTHELQAVSGDLQQTLLSLRDGMESLRQVGQQAGRVLAPDSTVLFRLEQTLARITEAADSIQRLAEQVDRNPGILVRGRAQTETTP